MNSTPAGPFTAAEVLHTAAAVVAVRGYYQPLSRQWEEARPTAMDVESLMFGWAMPIRERAAFERAMPAAGQAVADIVAWCRAGAALTGNEYRTKLARLVDAPQATLRDLPLLCSAVSSWQREAKRVAADSERAAEADHSTHQGTTGQRLNITATLVVVVTLPVTTYGYREQAKHLLRFRDDRDNVYIWESTASRLPAQRDRVHLTGTVKKHTIYRGTAQTYLTRCRWTLADGQEPTTARPE